MSKKRTTQLNKGTAMEQKVETTVEETNVDTSVVTEGTTELDTTEAKEGEATGEVKTPVEGETLVEGADAPVATEETKLEGLGDDTDGLDVNTTAVGLDDLNPPTEQEEPEVKHYADPIDEYSVFARALRDTLRGYTVAMAPNYPVTPSEMLSQQATLARSLNRVFNHPNVVEFQEAMDVLVRAIKANPETFSMRYINRGMDNVALSAQARKQFETVMFIIPTAVLSLDGRKHYLNYGGKLSEIFPEDATGQVGTRLQSWMKRYLSIE